MKKFLSVMIVAVMAMALCVAASAMHVTEGNTTEPWIASTDTSSDVSMSSDTFYTRDKSGTAHDQMGLYGVADGNAHEVIKAHPIVITDDTDIADIGIRGWAGVKSGDKITAYGYKLNEGETVYEESFYVALNLPVEDAIVGAGGDSRYLIIIHVEDLRDATLITLVAKDEKGVEHDFMEFSINGEYTPASDNTNDDVTSNTPADPETPDNPPTSDAAVIAVASVAVVALAGAFIGKKALKK